MAHPEACRAKARIPTKRSTQPMAGGTTNAKAQLCGKQHSFHGTSCSSWGRVRQGFKDARTVDAYPSLSLCSRGDLHSRQHLLQNVPSTGSGQKCSLTLATVVRGASALPCGPRQSPDPTVAF